MKYWNKQGKYQKEYDRLFKMLVPKEGKAETEDGEILRVLSNVYYDVFNNGGCNLGSSGSKYVDLRNLQDYLDKLNYKWKDEVYIMSTLECLHTDVINNTGKKELYETLDHIVDFVVKRIGKKRGLL